MNKASRDARKITFVLFANQSLGSAAFISTATVSAIIGAQLSGNPSLAGLPSAVLQLGAAFSAVAIGIAMDKSGRRKTLAGAMLVGVFGSAIAVGAIFMGAFIAFLAGLVLLGVAQSSSQMSRFAAAEVHPPIQRGRAISNVVIGGTIGAVLGPLLVSPSGHFASTLQLDELAGPFIAAAVLFLLGAAAIFFFLKPDPRELGLLIAEQYPETSIHTGKPRRITQLLRNPATLVAVISMVFGQLIMVMLMGITSLHMRDHQHGLGAISLVISSHTFGMFAFSIISGRLTDRWGRGPVIITGSLILLVSCALAPLSPDVLPLSVALFLLGLGWNFCYVGGSTLLSDTLTPQERAQTQGANDFFIGLATARSSFISGLIFASQNYLGVGIVGGLLSLIPVTASILWYQKQRLLPPSAIPPLP